MGGYISVDAVKNTPDYSLQQEFMPLTKAEAKNRSETYNGYATALDGEIKKIFQIGPDDNMTVEAEAVRQQQEAILTTDMRCLLQMVWVKRKLPLQLLRSTTRYS